MKIAVMTCGGDCAGLNAVVRSVVVRAVRGYGWQVKGLQSGFVSLLNKSPEDIIDLDVGWWEKTGSLIEKGGTALRTINRFLPTEDDGMQETAQSAADYFHSQGFDALVIVGGDMSLTKVKYFAKAGMKIVGVPKTIDNDVTSTHSVGFHTAMQVGVDALDRLRTTAQSHNRVFVLEVMGRDAGFLPLSIAVSGGADAALLPEIPYKKNDLVEDIKKRVARDNYALVVVSEAACGEQEAPESVAQEGRVRYGGAGSVVASLLSEHVDADVRSVALGHVQRGGSPIAVDRLLGTRQGVAAVDALANGEHNIVLGWNGAQAVKIPLADVCVNQLHMKHDLVQLALKMDMFLGHHSF